MRAEFGGKKESPGAAAATPWLASKSYEASSQSNGRPHSLVYSSGQRGALMLLPPLVLLALRRRRWNDVDGGVAYWCTGTLLHVSYTTTL
jgi:hypothetical protein